MADLTKYHLGAFFHERVEDILSSSEEVMKQKIKDLFYEFDRELLVINRGRLYSGTTVTGVLFNSTSVITINIGDSQDSLQVE